MRKIGIYLVCLFLVVFVVSCNRYLAEESLLEEEPVSLATAEFQSKTPSVEGSTTTVPSSQVKRKFAPFPVYTDRISSTNHYCPSGWMGDYGAITLDESCRIKPRSGKTCIKISYSAERTQGQGWAGIYWQNPPNNWGTVKGGYDLTGATKLEFWARGEKGGEIAEFKMGGITGEYPDSDNASLGVVQLKRKWQKFEIDLKGLDLSYISGGFVWVTSANDNPQGCTIFLDDIIYK